MILAKINAQQAKARERNPELITFLDRFKAEFPGGEGHFYATGKPYTKGITMDRCMLSAKWDSYWKGKKK